MNYDRIIYRFFEHTDWHDETSPLRQVMCNIVDGSDPTVAVTPFEFCTGLKDHNDYLVFEGDYVIDDNGTCYEVVWDDDCAEFELREDGWREVLANGSLMVVEPISSLKDPAQSWYTAGNIHTGHRRNPFWCDDNHSSMIG